MQRYLCKQFFARVSLHHSRERATRSTPGTQSSAPPIADVERRGSEGRCEQDDQAAAARAATNAATQRSTCSALCAADSCTRMRARPRGTTGKLNAVT